MAESKKHHYVPQHILKNFSIDNQKKRVYVLDVTESKIYPTSINKAGCENNFNAYSDGDSKINFESFFDENDHSSGIIINKIIKNSNLSCLSKLEFDQLSSIMINQYLRTSYARDTMSYLREKITNLILRNKTLHELTKEEREFFDKYNLSFNVTDDDKKSSLHNYLKNLSKEFYEILKFKIIFLIKCFGCDRFIISDNPICCVGDKELSKSLRGSEGLWSPRVEIFYPISEKLCLALFCPIVYEEIQCMIDNGEDIREEVIELYVAMYKNGVLNVQSEYVWAINIEQLKRARRYVYSSDKNIAGLDTFISK